MLKKIALLSFSALFSTTACGFVFASASYAATHHGLAMHGTPALPADFTHFPYVNPEAPKGGAISYGVIGTFDSLNPFVLKSMRTTARGLFLEPEYGNLVYEPLMQRSRDEAFSLYGLIAQSVEMDDERRWIEFTLNPDARWSDGQPITVEDILFTYDLLGKKGRPPYDSRIKRIEKIEKTAKDKVRFTFTEQADREFPLLIASSMPVLPKHAIDADNFGNASLKAPIGSGPYRVAQIQPGQRIVFERNPDYWAKDLPSKRGQDNYDKIIIEYFRNQTSLYESFKKGLTDIYLEGDPTHWQQAYDFPAAREGHVIQDSFKRGTPVNFMGLAFNTRRPIFADSKVRHALSMLFDFEWSNRNLFSGLYQRTKGYWDGSYLSSIGKQADEREKTLLAPFADAVRNDVMDGSWRPTETDGSGNDRDIMRQGYELLQAAGFTFDKGTAFGPDGKAFGFEIMTRSPDEEKIAIVFKRNLQRLGINVMIRTVDDAQYQQRMQTYDYDMIIGALSGTISPGNEQWGRWGSTSRDMPGSFNYPGVANPAADAMINAMLAARSQEDFISAVRAFDRVLISGDYYVPLYHLPEQWVARWQWIKRPEKTPLYGYQLPAWWDSRSQKSNHQ